MMGIVQRIEESKAAAQQVKQEEDQTALIAALEAEMAEENEVAEEVPDPAIEVDLGLVAEEETAEQSTKTKGKKS